MSTMLRERMATVLSDLEYVEGFLERRAKAHITLGNEKQAYDLESVVNVLHRAREGIDNALKEHCEAEFRAANENIGKTLSALAQAAKERENG